MPKTIYQLDQYYINSTSADNFHGTSITATAATDGKIAVPTPTSDTQLLLYKTSGATVAERTFELSPFTNVDMTTTSEEGVVVTFRYDTAGTSLSIALHIWDADTTDSTKLWLAPGTDYDSFGGIDYTNPPKQSPYEIEVPQSITDDLGLYYNYGDVGADLRRRRNLWVLGFNVSNK